MRIRVLAGLLGAGEIVLHRPIKILVALLALMLVVSEAQADTPENCGTIVIPTGLGVSSGADITSFNPLLVNSLYNQQAAGLMYLGLIWVNGNTGQIDWHAAWLRRSPRRIMARPMM